jgi:hypothetical protein
MHAPYACHQIGRAHCVLRVYLDWNPFEPRPPLTLSKPEQLSGSTASIKHMSKCFVSIYDCFDILSRISSSGKLYLPKSVTSVSQHNSSYMCVMSINDNFVLRELTWLIAGRSYRETISRAG